LLRSTRLNRTGNRCATRKGLHEWAREAAPDCICVQELRAQPGAAALGRQPDRRPCAPCL